MSEQHSVSIRSARNLTTTHKTSPQMLAKSPRWLLKFIPWIDVPGGTYRINQTKLALKGKGRLDLDFSGDGMSIQPSALREIPLFARVADEVLSAMVDNLKSETAKRGEVVATEGRDGDKLFIMVSGHAELLGVGLRGEELRVATVGPGDFFGEDELLFDSDAKVTVRTTTDCVVLTLAATDLERIFSEKPDLKEMFDRGVQQRQEELARLNDYGEQVIEMTAGQIGEVDVPVTYVDYIEDPTEIMMSLVQTVLRVHTRVSDLYNNPMLQLQMQMMVTATYMYERQEWELINNPDFGLLATCDSSMRLQPRYGPPTPDDFDAMLAMVWKTPTFFLLHPRALAAFERECTWRGVPPATMEIMGGTFLTWRGVPLIPSDKVEIDGHMLSRQGPGETNILLVRAGGEDVQGVAGLHQVGIPGEIAPSMSVKQMGIDNKAIASYLMTLYFALAVHANDAVAVLENVEVGYHHDYDHPPRKTK